MRWWLLLRAAWGLSGPLRLPGVSDAGLAERDSKYMRLALEQARLAYDAQEVPIGAVVVDANGIVEAATRNAVETELDASAHAELLCLRAAAAQRGNWRLLGATLYSTLEPCAMCLAAAHAFRVARIVYAAPDLRLGAVESWMSFPQHPFHTIDITSGVHADDSAALLKSFFAERRRGAAAAAAAPQPGE
ncbi:cytidine deaminase-like protein [Pelagophyceae sp. CCMP2097]|nr:cytidine deaminase-like protein [Pelagophyceae sp. CCMP2097]